MQSGPEADLPNLEREWPAPAGSYSTRPVVATGRSNPLAAYFINVGTGSSTKAN